LSDPTARRGLKKGDSGNRCRTDESKQGKEGITKKKKHFDGGREGEVVEKGGCPAARKYRTKRNKDEGEKRTVGNKPVRQN